jgi:hypothetical protein
MLRLRQLASALLALLAIAGCETPAGSPDVRYGESPALGTWMPEARDPVAEDPTGPAGSAAAGAGSFDGAAGEPGSAMNPVLPNWQAGQAAPAGASGGSTGGMGALAGQGGAGMEVAVTPDLGLGSLQFQVLTKTLDGKYSPKNVGAIWVETSSGAFVKTLEVWAARRARYLERWRSEAASNSVDAVTGATLRTHVMHDATWDLTDVDGATVMPGDYKLVVEITDHDGVGDSTEVPFTLGDPLMISPTDQAHFVDMALTVE